MSNPITCSTVFLAVVGSQITAAASPSSRSASGDTFAITDSVTATPTGGISPYTYTWQKVSGDTVTLTAGSSATTAFEGYTGLDNPITYNATYRCQVVDSQGRVAYTNNVTVQLVLSGGA